MSFSENLKQIRKDNHWSQEDLAELLDVSRQAVSKWEQGAGYPETEKLLLLSSKLNLSLDALMSTGFAPSAEPAAACTHPSIVISSPNENVIVTCTKVLSSSKFHGGKNAPLYALFGGNSTGSSFWGEPATFLAWYADQETLEQEMQAISTAISQGQRSYTLQYSAKTIRRWLKIKMV